MSEARDLETKNSAGAAANNFWRRIGTYAGIALAAFLLGLIPMWLTARGYVAERNQTRADLRVSRMQNRLATATMHARRGEYEAARQATSDFFTDLRSEVDRSQDTPLNEQQRGAMRPTLAQRDELITLLARGDAAAADRLADLYFAYRQTMNPGGQNAQ